MITTTLAVFAFITSALIGVHVQQRFLVFSDEGEATNITGSVATGIGAVVALWVVAFANAWWIYWLTGAAG